jgi:hypothetical protein
MAVSKRTRYEVLNRDGFTCRYCHETDVPLTLDHVVPVALGGSDKPDNLVAACQPCNAGKASVSPDAETVDQVNEDALRWAGAMQKAAEILTARDREADEFVDLFDQCWPKFSKPRGYQQTILQLRAAGLTREMLIDSVDVALNAYGVESRFRYFCGVCWRKVRELQEVARQLIEEATD